MVQEAQVAKFACEGLLNPLRLVPPPHISARTAEYHLSKVFMKLNITSRIQLEHVPDLAPRTLGSLRSRRGRSEIPV